MRKFLLILIFFFLYLPVSIFAENKILVGKITSLSGTHDENLEKLISKKIQSFPQSSAGVEIGNFGNTKEGIEKANKESYSHYVEVYYRKKENFPPEIFIASFDPKKKYLIDIVSEKSMGSIPQEVKIVKEEFKESDEEVIDNVLKKFSVSLSFNSGSEIMRENIAENFQDKDIREFLSDYQKKETKEEKADSAFNYLNEEFDTATRSKKKIEDLPITVSTISNEEIRNYNYRTLVEALKFKMGIMVSEPGNGETGHHFYQRGLLGNNYSKVLLNGMPLAPSVNLGMPINEMLYLKHAESIEVVYGPASAVYGADAFSGVVNIKTIPKKYNTVSFETHVGDFGYLNTNFYAVQKAKVGEGDLVVNIYGLKSGRRDQNIKNGYSDVYFAEKYYQRNGEFGDRTNFFSEIPSKNQSFGIGISYNKFHIFIDSLNRTDHSSIGQQSSFYSYNDSGAKWEDNITRYAMKNSFDYGKFTFNTNVSYNQYRLDNSSNYNLKFEKTPLYKFMASDDILAEQTVIWKINNNLDILGGISYQYSGVFPKTNDLKLPFNENFYQPFSTKKPLPDSEFGDFGNNPNRFQNTAAFLQSTFNWNKFSVIAGARYDYHTLYGKTINPRVAFIHKIFANTSYRLSYTEGFKGAPIYLSYNSIATGTRADGITYLYVPNNNLQPEKLRSYEAGLRHLILKNISMEIVFFHNYIENKFNSLKVPRNPIEYPYSTQERIDTTGNLGSANLNGLDFVLNFTNIHKPTQLNIYFSNSFAKGTEVLSRDYSLKTTELEEYLLNQYDPNRNKINNYRNIPRRSSTLRVSVKLFSIWFLALDTINSEGWYSGNIRTKAQYDSAEYNKNFDPYFTKNKIEPFTIVDLNTYVQINSFLRIVSKITNLTNEVFSGKAAYDGPNNLDINPQYRRNVYLGIEGNYAW
ncbi:MAG: TonB-dependent receptor [Leptospiraceae bacterium]|nr:TonB-dependent receptor [Leptospiraceae bacterium]